MANCQITGCTNESDRTLGRSRITNALKEERLELNVRDKVTKVKVCKVHYRKIKKYIKKDTKIDRVRWGI